MATVRTSESERLRRLSLLATRAFVDSGLHGIDAEVHVALDVSVQMAPMFLNGSIQQLVESLLALGMRFDDDGVIPAWAFGEDARPLGELTRQDYVGWTERHIRCPEDLEGECRYAPIIEAIGRRHFPREWALPMTEKKVGGALKRTVRVFPPLLEKRPLPIFVILVTAGDCADPTETIRAIQRASHLPIFFQFAGISPPGIPAPGFAFLERIDRLPDRHADNCGFFSPRDYTDPTELFEGLLNEFPDYLELPQVKEMLVPPPPEEGYEPRVVVNPSDPKVIAQQRERLERQRRREERAREEAAALARGLPSVGPGAHVVGGDDDDAPDAPPDAPPRRASPMTRPYQREYAAPRPDAAPPTPTPATPRAPAPAPAGPSPRVAAARQAATPTPRQIPRPVSTPTAAGPTPTRTGGPAPRPPASPAGPTGAPPARAPAPRAATPTPAPPATPPAAPPAVPIDDEDPAVRLERIRARRAARRARGGTGQQQ